MEASIAKHRKMTIEEYIRFEELSPVRHEFNNGKLIEMPGTTDRHNDICGNIYMRLRQLLKGTPCKVYQENVKSQLIDGRRYTYPDIFVTCNEQDLTERYIKKYPSVIFEVLSDSTKITDKTTKFIEYQKIKSLQHYILVDSEKTFVEIFSKNSKGEWMYNEVFLLMTDILTIVTLDISLTLEDIYEIQ